MCKILVATKNNGHNEEFSQLIKFQYSELVKEEDGIGALIIDKDNTIKTFRSLEDYARVFSQVNTYLDTARLVAIHARTATSGNVDLNNVHFFEVNNGYFAHNGFVSKYHTFENKQFWFGFNRHKDKIYFEDEPKSEQEISEILANCNGCFTAKIGACKKHIKFLSQLENIRDDEVDKDLEKTSTKKPIVKVKSYSDSYQFMQNLKRPFDVNVIEEHISDSIFTGMGVLVDKATRQTYVLAHKQCNLVSDKQTYVAAFSYDPVLSMDINQTESIFGIEVILEKKTTKIEQDVKSIVSGTYLIHENQKTLEK